MKNYREMHTMFDDPNGENAAAELESPAETVAPAITAEGAE